MKVKYLCAKLEYKLKEKFPDVMLEEVYFSRRRNIYTSPSKRQYIILKGKKNFSMNLKTFIMSI